jgi:TolB protein
MPPRTLRSGQGAEVWIGGPDRAEPELVFETAELLVEAPNWSLDGGSLFLNGDGRLWRFDLGAVAAELVQVPYDDLPELNNDHVLDPDGEHIYLSANDGHIYRGGLGGGRVERVTPDDGAWHFLHGVAPDGSQLAYVALENFDQPGRLMLLEPGGVGVGVETGAGHLDGPEWSPDGQWIYFNTEAFTSAPGHAQLGRIATAGGPVERVLSSQTVDWFPHLSPDGRSASYIAFPAGTLGHPADLDVEVRVVAVSDWSTPLQRYPFFGGQGSLNVNSWAPDSDRFAFVAYPIVQSVA